MLWWRRRTGQGGNRRLTLHIGTPKSGTTHLQARLRAARAELRGAGVLYPGADHPPRGGLNQQGAMYAVAPPEVHWATPVVRANGARQLERLRTELDRHPGHALVSAEVLASFTREAIPILLDALGYPPDSVRVVITARDAGRLLTSAWQENVKNGATQAMVDYLASIAVQRSGGESPFWRAYGLPRLVERWAAVVGMANVVLVTVPSSTASPTAPGSRPRTTDLIPAQASGRPGSGSRLARPPGPRRPAPGGEDLWSRYTRACWLPSIAAPPPARRQEQNLSLSGSQVELLRQVNLILDQEQVPHPERQVLRSHLLQAWMGSAAGGGAPLGLDPEWLPTLRLWASDDRAALDIQHEQGLHLVGTLDDLDPSPVLAVPGSPPPRVTDAAADLLAVLRDLRRQVVSS